MVKLIDLGHIIAKIEDNKDFVDLSIISPGYESEGTGIYSQGQSIKIYGVASIKTLQAALNDFFHDREDE